MKLRSNSELDPTQADAATEVVAPGEERVHDRFHVPRAELAQDDDPGHPKPRGDHGPMVTLTLNTFGQFIEVFGKL